VAYDDGIKVSLAHPLEGEDPPPEILRDGHKRGTSFVTLRIEASQAVELEFLRRGFEVSLADARRHEIFRDPWLLHPLVVDLVEKDPAKVSEACATPAAPFTEADVLQVHKNIAPLVNGSQIAGKLFAALVQTWLVREKGIEVTLAARHAAEAGRCFLGQALRATLLVTGGRHHWARTIKLRCKARTNPEVRLVYKKAYDVIKSSDESFPLFHFVDAADGIGQHVKASL